MNNTQKTMKGIIYVRVSSEEQVQGTSLETQEQACRAFCASKEIEVLRVFREEGASAKTKDRKALLEAMDYCKKQKGGLSAFVVWKVDRLARNAEDHFYVRGELHKHGIALMSVTEVIGQDPSEKLFETLLAGFAEFDNAVRRQRSMNGMKARLLQGLWPWQPPLGYIVSHFNKQGLKKTMPNEPDPTIFPILRKGLKAYATGHFSQAEIVLMLEKEGLHHLIDKRRILSQMMHKIVWEQIHFYAGILVNPWPATDGKDQYVKGLHEPMITEEELQRIILIRAGRKPTQAKYNRHNPKFILRRTVLCAHCERPLTGSSPRGRTRRYAYYHCYNLDCTMRGKGIPVSDIEMQFREKLQKINPTREFLLILDETVREYWGNRDVEKERLVSESRNRLAGYEKQRERIYEMRESGDYTPEEFRTRKADIEQRIAEIKIATTLPSSMSFDLNTALEHTKEQVSDLPKTWQGLKPHLRPRFQKLVFPAGISYHRENGFGTAKLGSIFELSQLSTAENSSLG